jgi:hypothetical protein
MERICDGRRTLRHHPGDPERPCDPTRDDVHLRQPGLDQVRLDLSEQGYECPDETRVHATEIAEPMQRHARIDKRFVRPTATQCEVNVPAPSRLLGGEHRELALGTSAFERRDRMDNRWQRADILCHPR